MSVYFIQSGVTGPVKIGCAENCKKRLVSLQCASASPLKLINVLPRSFSEERIAHRIFEDGRLRGEWFKFHPDMLRADLDLSPSPKIARKTSFSRVRRAFLVRVITPRNNFPAAELLPGIVVDERLVGWAGIRQSEDKNSVRRELMLAGCHPDLILTDIAEGPIPVHLRAEWILECNFYVAMKYAQRGATLVIRSWNDFCNIDVKPWLETLLADRGVGLRVLR